MRAVLYYETLDQLRDLQPALAQSLPLTFADCASGPMGSCPLEEVRRHAESLIPPDCGLPPARRGYGEAMKALLAGRRVSL